MGRPQPASDSCSHLALALVNVPVRSLTLRALESPAAVVGASTHHTPSNNPPKISRDEVKPRLIGK